MTKQRISDKQPGSLRWRSVPGPYGSRLLPAWEGKPGSGFWCFAPDGPPPPMGWAAWQARWDVEEASND